jgi:hypothetical protein
MKKKGKKETSRQRQIRWAREAKERSKRSVAARRAINRLVDYAKTGIKHSLPLSIGIKGGIPRNMESWIVKRAQAIIAAEKATIEEAAKQKVLAELTYKDLDDAERIIKAQQKEIEQLKAKDKIQREAIAKFAKEQKDELRLKILDAQEKGAIGPHEDYEEVLRIADELDLTPNEVFTEWVYMGMGGSMIA